MLLSALITALPAARPQPAAFPASSGTGAATRVPVIGILRSAANEANDRVARSMRDLLRTDEVPR